MRTKNYNALALFVSIDRPITCRYAVFTDIAIYMSAHLLPYKCRYAVFDDIAVFSAHLSPY